MHRTTQRSQPPGGTTRKQNPAASSYPRDNNGQTHRRTWAPNKETQPQKAERPLAATLRQGNRPHPKPPHNRQTYNERPQGSRKVPTSTARRERGGPPRRGHERTGEGKEQGTEPTGHRSSENGHTHTRDPPNCHGTPGLQESIFAILKLRSAQKVKKTKPCNGTQTAFI